MPIALSTKESPAPSAGMLGLMWLALFKELRVEWLVNPLYAYGWGVPLLMVYLFWRRWMARPAPTAKPLRLFFWVSWLFLLALLFPLRLIQEANPDWRLISWVWGFSTVGLSLGVLYGLGGTAWVRHLSPPILFGLLAVPWPHQVEDFATQRLMVAVTGVTTEGLNWLGIAAVQQGNTIELSGQTVGVEEACSGIRSLQTLLMLAFVAGEVYRLNGRGRLILLPLAAVVAVVFNIFRTSALTWLCLRIGATGETRWHDPAGWLALGAGVASLWGAAHFLRHDPGDEEGSEPAPVGSGFQIGFPKWATGIALFWLIWSEVGTSSWYRLHERNLKPRQLAWNIHWPDHDPNFQQLTLPERTRALLRSDEHQAGIWMRPDGSEWTIFSLGWKPGRMAAQLATGHTPDVCLTSTGLRSVAEWGLNTAVVHGLVMPFNTYEFEGRGRRYFAFFCLMSDRETFTGTEAARAAENHLVGLLWRSRWQAVQEGRRHGGQRVLEVVIRGPASRQEAFAALKRALPELVEVEET